MKNIFFLLSIYLLIEFLGKYNGMMLFLRHVASISTIEGTWEEDRSTGGDAMRWDDITFIPLQLHC